MNEPAFPQYVINSGGVHVDGGMTLLDYFAAKALQGICANSNEGHNPYEMTYEEYAIEIAESAYQLANAMMKARKQ